MRPGGGLGAVLLLALASAACGGSAASAPATTPTTAPTPVGPPVTVAPPPSAKPASPPATLVPQPSGSAVVRDDSLLAILPPDIDGTPVTVEEQSFDEAVADPAFATNVDRAAFAVVTTPTDLASGVVAELRDGVLDDGFFADWRETYNHGACAQAGGVTTNAETQLGGRTVYIARCRGGITVYHAAIPERDLIVSLFSLGAARFGERLISDLRP